MTKEKDLFSYTFGLNGPTPYQSDLQGSSEAFRKSVETVVAELNRSGAQDEELQRLRALESVIKLRNPVLYGMFKSRTNPMESDSGTRALIMQELKDEEPEVKKPKPGLIDDLLEDFRF